MKKEGTCKLCGRESNDVTEHHLIPRSTHKTKRIRAMHTTKAMHKTAPLCQPCHRACHQFYNEKELATDFYTIELLLADEGMAKHVAWVRKQRGDLRMKRSAKGRAK